MMAETLWCSFRGVLRGLGVVALRIRNGDNACRSDRMPARRPGARGMRIHGVSFRFTGVASGSVTHHGPLFAEFFTAPVWAISGSETVKSGAVPTACQLAVPERAECGFMGLHSFSWGWRPEEGRCERLHSR